MQHILPMAAPKLRSAAIQHAPGLQKTRPQQQGFPLKPHQRQFRHQGPERQQQVQQGVQHSLEDEPAARRMTLQEMRDASFAAAGLCPKVPMKVS